MARELPGCKSSSPVRVRLSPATITPVAQPGPHRSTQWTPPAVIASPAIRARGSVGGSSFDDGNTVTVHITTR